MSKLFKQIYSIQQFLIKQPSRIILFGPLPFKGDSTYTNSSGNTHEYPANTLAIPLTTYIHSLNKTG